MRAFLSIITIVLVYSLGHAQDPVDHLRALLERLATAKSYHAVAHVNMVDANGKVLVAEKSEAYCEDGRSWSSIGPRTTVMNEKEFLFVDLVEKQMIYEVREHALQAPAKDDLEEQLSNMLTQSVGRLQVWTQDERTITLRLVGDEGDDYASTDLVLRKKDHLLERIVYHVNGPARNIAKDQVLDRIEVVYTLFQVNIDVPDARFDLRSWVRPGKDGKMTPAPGHEDLELIQNSGI